jgi:HD-like signal output (HDOD) protein
MTAGDAASMRKIDPGNLEQQSLRDLIEEEIQSGRAVPQVMPQVGARVREVTRKGDYTLAELTSVIQSEAALAARILRYANSAAYAGLTEITGIQQAVTRLGARMVESIAVAAATRELYKARSSEEGQAMEVLWKHSVAAGEIGRLIAQEVHYAQPEEAFLTCLLHDVGWVAIVRALGTIEQEKGEPVGQGLRQEILDSLHAECGDRLLKSWSVPEVVCEAVRFHHEPEKAPQQHDLPHIVHMADSICSKLGVSQEPNEALSLLALPSTSYLKFDDMRIAVLMVEAEDALQRASKLT